MQKADYEIVAALVVDDRTPRAIRPIHLEFDAVEKHAKETGRNITSYLKGALAAVGGVAAIRGISRGIIGLNSEIEAAQSGMASLFTAFSGAPIEQSLARARGVLRGLREDAATGAGELSNYLEGFQRIFGATGGLVSDELVRELTRNALVSGEALRGSEGLKLAPMDIAQAIQQGVSATETPIVATALQAIGMTAAEFKALAPEEKVRTLNEAFGTFREGAKLMGMTWDAQMSSFTDGIKEFIRTATQPVFGDWKKRLVEANEWMGRNTDTMRDMAENWGQRLLGVWDHLINSATTYASILGAIAAIEAAPSVGRRVQGGLGGLAQAGGFIGPMGRNGLPFRDLFTKAGAASVGRGLLSTLPKLAKGTGVLTLVAAAIDGMMGAWREFPGVANFVMGAVGQVTDAFGELMDGLSSWTGDGSILNRIGAALLVVGGGLIHFLGILLRVGATVARIIGFMAQAVGNPFAVRSQARSMWEDIQGIWTFGPKDPRAKAAEDAAEGAAPKPDGSGVSGSVTNVYVNEVNVDTEVNSDPARVFRAFEEVADRTRRFARAARRNPAFG